MDIKKIIETRIKEFGYTKKEFSNKMGILPSNLNSMISNPSFPTLIRVATTLGLTVSELVRDENDTRKTSVTCPHCGKEIQIEVK